jgi:hypothetical protein
VAQERLDNQVMKSQFFLDEFKGGLPLSQTWEGPSCEEERDWDSTFSDSFDQSFNLEPFGDP